MIAPIVDALAIALLAAGLALATIGLIGLLRNSNIYLQTHAAGLVTGPAVVAVLLAALAIGEAETITSALLVAVFVVITAPLSSHAIASAAHRRERDERATRGDDSTG